MTEQNISVEHQYRNRWSINEKFKDNQFKNKKITKENRINLEVFLKC